MTTQEIYLSRAEAAAHVKSLGVPCALKTLQRLASEGGGPVYRKFGNRALYLPSDLVAWVSAKLSAPRLSTSSEVQE